MSENVLDAKLDVSLLRAVDTLGHGPNGEGPPTRGKWLTCWSDGLRIAAR